MEASNIYTFHFPAWVKGKLQYKISIYVGWVREAEWGRNDSRCTAVLADSIVPDGLLEFGQVMCASCLAKFYWRSGTAVGGPPESLTANQKLTKNWKLIVFLTEIFHHH